MLQANFDSIQSILTKAGIAVATPKPIQYGLQTELSGSEGKGTLRIYEGKKGLKIDLSQIHSSILHAKVSTLLNQPKEKGAHSPKSGLTSLSLRRRGVGSEVLKETFPSPIIGTDESGKGDYFGPLVVAGAYVEKKDEALLKSWGVQDSKQLSDTVIAQLAQKIQAEFKHHITILTPEKYNEIYPKIGNLNQLLAMIHTQTIAKLHDTTHCHTALTDQFANPKVLKHALEKTQLPIQLFQHTQGESCHISVAAASILARAAFVSELHKLSIKVGLPLPKGASDIVTKAAKKLVQEKGESALHQVAKLHFKITKSL